MGSGDDGAQTLLDRVSAEAEAEGLTRTAAYAALAKKP